MFLENSHVEQGNPNRLTNKHYFKLGYHYTTETKEKNADTWTERNAYFVRRIIRPHNEISGGYL